MGRGGIGIPFKVEVTMQHLRSLAGVVALLLVSGASLHAQAPIQLGVAGGVSIADVTGDDTEDASSRTAPFFGGVLVWQPMGIAGFQTGLYYVGKGAESDLGGETGKVKINYVEIPLLLRLALRMGESAIRPVITAGGYVAFKASCDVEAGDFEAECDEVFSDLAEEDVEVESVDYGVSAGLAIDIPVGERTIVAPLVKYSRGMRDIFKVDPSLDAKNTAVQVGVEVRVKM